MTIKVTSCMHTFQERKNTHVHTMIHRLMNTNSQKEANMRSSAHHTKHFQAPCSSRSPLSPCSPTSLHHHKWINLQSLPLSRYPHDADLISSALRR